MWLLEYRYASHHGFHHAGPLRVLGPQAALAPQYTGANGAPRLRSVDGLRSAVHRASSRLMRGMEVDRRSPQPRLCPQTHRRAGQAASAAPKSVHTRLGHPGSRKDSAMAGLPQSACTNVVWFDLDREMLRPTYASCDLCRRTPVPRSTTGTRRSYTAPANRLSQTC
jgi:hypothetical protein